MHEIFNRTPWLVNDWESDLAFTYWLHSKIRRLQRQNQILLGYLECCFVKIWVEIQFDLQVTHENNLLMPEKASFPEGIQMPAFRKFRSGNNGKNIPGDDQHARWIWKCILPVLPTPSASQIAGIDPIARKKQRLAILVQDINLLWRRKRLGGSSRSIISFPKTPVNQNKYL